MLRKMKSLWCGSQADESKSLLSSAPLNYLSGEEKPPTNRDLFEKNKKIVEEKKPFFETAEKLIRVDSWIVRGAWVVIIADPIYRLSYAYHAAQDVISDRIKNDVMPVWSSLTSSCLAGVEKELGITSPE